MTFWLSCWLDFLTWLTPGPDTMYIVARSIAQGRRAGVLSALGIGTGLLVHTLLAAFGLSAILATSALAFTVVKVLGACYLIYLGIRLLLKKRKPSTTPNVTPLSDWLVYRQGVLSNVFNPKVARGPTPFLVLGAVFVVGGTLWSLGQAVFAASATVAIRQNTIVLAWLERVSGCVYIGLGLNMLRPKVHAV
jgi:threonine/homoserine/homoserine lactone efflux protein